VAPGAQMRAAETATALNVAVAARAEGFMADLPMLGRPDHRRDI
jgi:hypothetical protein